MAIKVANNQSLTAITALPSGVSAGAMTLLETQTASSSATISFTSGIDSTYDEYVFRFYDIHPATDGQYLTVNFRDGSTAYDATKTTTFFQTFHSEDDATDMYGSNDPGVTYDTAEDLAQSTSAQRLCYAVGNDNDQSTAGTLHLFSPSSTTFVKHFYSTFSVNWYTNANITTYVAGYCNVVAAIDGVQFKMASGNIDAGVIKLYGIS